MICGHGLEQNFKYPNPRAKAIDQIPALCPASPPPRRIDIDRCIRKTFTESFLVVPPKQILREPKQILQSN